MLVIKRTIGNAKMARIDNQKLSEFPKIYRNLLDSIEYMFDKYMEEK